MACDSTGVIVPVGIARLDGNGSSGLLVKKKRPLCAELWFLFNRTDEVLHACQPTFDALFCVRDTPRKQKSRYKRRLVRGCQRVTTTTTQRY